VGVLRLADRRLRGFLSDPDIPAIAWELALREPPVKADPVAQYDS
jgi:hypothetical protein